MHAVQHGLLCYDSAEVPELFGGFLKIMGASDVCEES